MNKKILLIALIALCAQCQISTFSPAFGCASFNQNGVCTSCKDRYYMFSFGNLCLPVSPLCKDYSRQTGACTSCVDGFQIKQATCQPVFNLVPVVQQLPPNCVALNSATSTCDQCAVGFTNVNGACVQTIPNCQIHNQDGKCSRCLSGFSYNGVSCLRIVTPTDPNCRVADANGCIQCIDRFFRTNRGTCVRMSPLCNSYNIDGTCGQCEPNFVSDGKGGCILRQSLVNRIVYDPLCSRFEKGVCVRCSFGTFFDSNKVCRQASPLCRQIDVNGNCLSCYNGYELKDGKCIVLMVQLDPNCGLFNGTKCIRCSNGARFDVNGKCVINDPNCRSWNGSLCTGCYPGYIINDKGSCIIDTDFNCADWSNGQCNRCSKGYYLDNNKCKAISPFCAKFDFTTKTCSSCYLGYVQYQGECSQISKLSNLTGFDLNCKNYDNNGICNQCFQRYYLESGKCLEVSAFCKTFNALKGYCTSCYPGYVLDLYGSCIIETY